MKIPIVSPAPHQCFRVLNLIVDYNKLWVEQFRRIELQPKWKEVNGKYSDRDWTRRIERNLIKCSPIHD